MAKRFRVIDYEGRQQGLIDLEEKSFEVVEAIPELRKLLEQIRKEGISVLGPGPEEEGALTDQTYTFPAGLSTLADFYWELHSHGFILEEVE